MKPIFVLLICVFTFTPYIYSQVPGYQGKRLIVEGLACAYHFPPNILKIGAAAKNIRLNTGLRIEYVTGRKRAFAISYEPMGTFTTQANYLGADNKLGSATINNNASGFGISYIRYAKAKWCLAPFGRYWSYGLTYVPVRSTIVSEKSDIVPNTPLRTKDWIASIGLGVRNIYWDRVTANLGVQAGLSLNGFKNSLSDVDNLSDEQRLSGNIGNYLTRDYFLKIYLAFGLLVK